MTAIFGSTSFNGEDIASGLDRMQARLAPYGRDKSGKTTLNSIGLGYCLNALVPEARWDRQPVQSDSSRYIVVADVLLTEREDLMKQLSLSPTDKLSDSTIVAMAIERWHEEAFDKIYGSFAIAAWDTQEQRFLLARDHVGDRPLAYHLSSQHFVFASMPAGLVAYGCVSGEVDPLELERWLAVLRPSPDSTHFKGINRIKSGHWAEVKDGVIKQVRYWKPELTPLTGLSHSEYVSGLDRVLTDAVRASLRGHEKGIGAHLSSGLDSTAVATTAAKILSGTETRLTAFTAVPSKNFVPPKVKNSILDEGDLAAKTAAQHANMDHVLVAPTHTPLDALDRSEIYGEPIMNLCNQTWLHSINDTARERKISVLLVADRGNGTISEDGYMALPEFLGSGRILDWFRVARAYKRAGYKRWRALLWDSVNPYLPQSVSMKIERWTGRGLGIDYERITALPAQRLNELIADDTERVTDEPPYDKISLNSHAFPQSSMDERLATLGRDYGFYYKGVLGEWGLDCREPTINRRLVEYTLRVPIEQNAWLGGTRSLIREVLTDRAPLDVTQNTLLGRQGVEWFTMLGAAVKTLDEQVGYIEDFADTSSLIDTSRLQRLVRDWPEDETGLGIEANVDYRMSILRAISASNFMRRAAGSNF